MDRVVFCIKYSMSTFQNIWVEKNFAFDLHVVINVADLRINVTI